MGVTNTILPLLGFLFLVESSQILAVWQQSFEEPPFPFTVTKLDPITARTVGPVMYSNTTLQSLFGGKTVFDEKEKIWYLQNFPQNSLPTIIGLDMSNPDSVKITKEVKITFEAFVIELDVVSRRLILAGAIPHFGDVHRRDVGQAGPNVEVGYIDLTTMTYKTLTHLPEKHWFFTIAGSSSALDSNTRLLVISMQNALVSPVQFWINTVNIDTGVVTSFQQKDYIVQSMISINNMVATIMTSQSDDNSSLEFGLVNIQTGLVTSKVQWKVPALAFVVNGISIKDEANGVIYSIVGNGINPPAALATIDIASGMLKEFHYFLSAGDYSQPQYIAITQ